MKISRFKPAYFIQKQQNKIIMNKEKYYTPEIEEFHVGFEFEFKSGNVEWKPFIFNPPKLDAVISNLGSKPDMFRVKHLDRKDIESLEFEYKGWNHVSYDYYKGDSKENTCISVFKDNSVSIQKRVEGLLESDINNIVTKNQLRHEETNANRTIFDTEAVG